MSTARLYRALLKTAPSSHSELGRIGYFLQQTNEGEEQTHQTQELVRKQFRRAVARSTNATAGQALNHGFEVLRALKSGTEIKRTPTTTQTNSAIQIADARATNAPSTISHGGVRRAGSVTARPAANARPSNASLSASTSFPSSSSSAFDLPSSSSSSGPALRRVGHRALAADGSILSRLHDDSEIHKRTPAPSASNSNDAAHVQDSKYASSAFQLSVYAEEYLKLVCAGPSTARSSSTSAQNGAPTSANIVLENGNELQLIESSRMRHQHARWLGVMCASLTRPQQIELESLVQTLGTAVEAKDVNKVKAFQAEIGNVESTLAVALLSNTQVVDAWMDFLYTQKEYSSLVHLFNLRLTCGVSVTEYGLSRASLCKVLVGCALEGDVVSSMIALRESSWAALTRAAEVDTDPNQAPIVTPSAVNRLPSWVPMYYLSPDADIIAPITRSAFEMENGPDPAMAAAADGFGIDTTPAHTPSSAMTHSRPYVNLHSRPLTYRPSTSLSSFSSLLGSTLLHPPTPTPTAQTSHASMSSLARIKPPPVQIPPPIAQVTDAPKAPTPLPLIDLWTELSLDSRLMELAIIAAARAEARAKEFAEIAEAQKVKSQAASHPLSDNPDINLSIHEHAAALFAQSNRNFTRRDSQPFEFDEEELEPDSADDEFDFDDDDDSDPIDPPATVFDAIHHPHGRSPIAYQLWSIMLQQKIPLQHSHTFVELINNLDANIAPLTAGNSRTGHILLQTIASEFEAARTNGSLKNKTMRSDLMQFRNRQLSLNESLAVGDDSGDSVWELLSILRQMQSESLKPDVATVARLYESILFGSQPGIGRSKLLQDMQIIIEDSGINMEDIIQQVTNTDNKQTKRH